MALHRLVLSDRFPWIGICYDFAVLVGVGVLPVM